MTAASVVIPFTSRRRRARVQQLDAQEARSLSGVQLGVVPRRFGLMETESAAVIAEAVASSGDLAVADRMAFIAAMERGCPIVVVAAGSTYVACSMQGALSAEDILAIRSTDLAAPRVMSVATGRGIAPALGPLGA